MTCKRNFKILIWPPTFRNNQRHWIFERCARKIIIIPKERKRESPNSIISRPFRFIDNRRHPKKPSITSSFHSRSIPSRNWSSYRNRSRWHPQRRKASKSRELLWRMCPGASVPHERWYCRRRVNKRENKRLTRQRLTPTMDLAAARTISAARVPLPSLVVKEALETRQ